MRGGVFLAFLIFLTGITIVRYAGLGTDTVSSPAGTGAILELDKTVYKPGESLVLTIRNSGGETLLVGSFYRLYRWEDGRWKGLDLGFSFTGIGYTIPPGGSWSQTVPLVMHVPEGTPGKVEPLPPGRYKIVKTVTIDRGRCGGRSDEMELSAEFEVVG